MPTATDETLATVRANLPGTVDQLAPLLGVPPSQVPQLIQNLRDSGYLVVATDGVYRGADNDLESYDVAVAEHRHIAYLKRRSATVAAQFHTPERQQAAAFWAGELEAIDEEMKRQRRVHVLNERLSSIQNELAQLTTSAP